MGYDNKDRMRVVAEGGNTFIPNGSGSIERAANATPYSDGDAVLAGDGGDMVFQNICQLDLLGGYITRAILSTDDPAFATEMRLWILSVPMANLTTPPTDNAALDLDALDMLSVQQLDGSGAPEYPFIPPNVLGYIDFPAPISCVSAAIAQWRGHFHFYAREGATPVHPLLYGVLQAKGIFTPVSGQVFDVTLGIERG